MATAGTATLVASQQVQMALNGQFRALPSPLPTGVTAYIPTRVFIGSSVAGEVLWCRLVNLGSIDISPSTFTDANAFPTYTELGDASVSESGVVFAEVTTVLNATPGSLAITYVDQNGNTAEATTAVALTASAAVGTGAFIALNAGDYAVRDITAAARTLGTTPTGVIKFWGVRPLIMTPVTSLGGTMENLLTSAFHPQRFAAGDQLAVIFMNTTQVKTSVMEAFFVGDT
jgi:hypothetical protein